MGKVQVNNITGCHSWTGYLDPNGYGRFAWSIYKGGNEMEVSSRAAYRLFNGEIPNGMFICHKCDNPTCVNPDHLFLGTQDDNMRDMAVKFRSRTKLSGQDILDIRNSDESSRGLARKYGFRSHKSIYNIKNRLSFDHV